MIAISATDKKLSASMDLRFGRCPYFLITDGKESKFISNPFCKDEHDIAPRVVEMLAKEKVNKIITGEIGPKAKTSLKDHHIQVIILSEDKISLQVVLKKMNFSK